ncbi:hypothetical protein RFI_05227 [Reticulomyxa filosa]|uniref:DH domain-containing protein n=1 Tax=Reticulomyxa filosa TaxID=46433 RepID=X6P2V7_RETFI|nr:hypothetical protein RFI_05227 [Reticulomyxa filosa]|eukprot:ETO31887.1 hypothetical protein RFI_05227 [Reticulomyxa filosa]
MAGSAEHEAENAIFYTVQELAQTERGYLKSLNQLRREYINKLLESKVLSEEKINAYFLEILMINGIHYLLSENLERELDCWPSSQIPQLFLQFVLFFVFFLIICLFICVPTFRVYTYYVLRYNWIAEEMKKLSHQYPELKKTLPVLFFFFLNK